MTASGHPATTSGTARSWWRLAGVHRAVEMAEWVAGAMLVASVLAMVVLQVSQRYLPISGWAWTGELARYALVWLTFLLAGYLAGRGEHIGLEVVDYLARGRLLVGIRRFADAVVAAIAVAFTVDAWSLTMASTGRGTPVMGIPLTLIYLVAVMGFALTAVRSGWAAVFGRPGTDPEPPAGSGQEAPADPRSPG